MYCITSEIYTHTEPRFKSNTRQLSSAVQSSSFCAGIMCVYSSLQQPQLGNIEINRDRVIKVRWPRASVPVASCSL